MLWASVAQATGFRMGREMGREVPVPSARDLKSGARGGLGFGRQNEMALIATPTIIPRPNGGEGWLYVMMGDDDGIAMAGGGW